MERPPSSPAASKNEDEYIPPPLILDGITITDVGGWMLYKNSPHVSDQVNFAIELAATIERSIAESGSVEDAWKASGKPVFKSVESHISYRALLILKKHWLYGEELYEAYRKSRS